MKKIVLYIVFIFLAQLVYGQTYTSSYPNYSNLTQTSVTVNVSIDNPMSDPSSYRVRCIASLATTPAPTLAQVNLYRDGNNALVAGNLRGTVTLDEFTTSGAFSTITGLVAGTNYILYLVTYDAEGPTYIEAQPTQLSFTTPTPPIPPSLSSTSPLDGSSSVSIGTNFVLTFNEAVKFNSTITHNTLKIYEEGVGTPIEVFEFFANGSDRSGEVSGSGTTSITINPNTSLSLNKNYYITVDVGAFESVLSSTPYPGFTEATTWNFTSVSAPTITTYNPDQNATGVAVNANFQLTFSEPVIVKSGFGTIKIKRTADNTTFDQFDETQIIVANNQISFTPQPVFLEGVQYYITIPSGLIEGAVSGAPFGGIDNSVSNNYRFTTINNAPVTTMTPNNGGVSLYPNILISFSKPARFTNGSAITSGNVKNLITSFQAIGHSVGASDYDATISADSKTVTLYLKTSLKSGLTYTVIVDRVEDFNGTEQLALFTEDFSCSVYNVWDGSESDDFGDANNFTGGYNGAAGVLLASGLTNYPVLTANTEMGSLIMEPGSRLTVNTNVNLTINNDFDLIANNSTNGQPSFMNNGSLIIGANKIKYHQRVSDYSHDYYVSSPINNGTLSVGEDLWQRVYDPYGWVETSGSLNAGQGYVSYNEAGTDLIVNGSSFNSNGVTINTTVSATNFGWHLAGNPFPTAIEWTDLIKTNMRDLFYMPLNDVGGWGTYINISGTPASTNLNGTTTQIPAFHAFYVQTDMAYSSGSVEIPTLARRMGDNNYLKSAAVTTSQLPLVKLVSKTEGSCNDETAIVYNSNGSLGAASDDAVKKLSSSNKVVDIFVVDGAGNKVAIKSAPELDGISEVVLPLGINAKQTGAFAIDIASVTNLPDNYSVILEDKVEQEMIDLQLGKYDYSVSSTGINTTRFALHLVPSVTTKLKQGAKSNDLTVLVNNKTVSVVMRSELENGTYELLDMNGRKLLIGKSEDLASGIFVKNVGVYLLIIHNTNGLFSAKVLIKE